MPFIADLHIHSKYSRATAKNLDLENLYVEARKKGITVICTGDSTHPAWFAELKDKLVPAEHGLFRLRSDLENTCGQRVPASCRGEVRFMLGSEISCIYKKDGKTRKNHNLVYFPDFDSAGRFNVKLGAIGNIRSDGRPILGLDARNLLEIVLETHEDAFLVPAHIWTPWFSLLGSKSGFDRLDECFGDLSPHIFAAETGLSSDPPMNWRVSFLDGITLVSNSDAHSPSKLGREANIFNTELSYSRMLSALKTGNPKEFLGTLEFFPEEGKYHNDGHRKCQVSLTPEDTVKYSGICPGCGKPMTLGVNYRVLELSDRTEGQKPERHHPFHSIIPLDEVLSEIYSCGVQSKKINQALETAVGLLGPELSILNEIPEEDLKKAGIPLLDEAIRRMRSHRLHIQPGYDGEFGKIKIFTEDERNELIGQQLLFTVPGDSLEKQGFQKAGSRKGTGQVSRKREKETPSTTREHASLNPEQEKAVNHTDGPLLIVAGPGTGKTHTLTRRIARLIHESNVNPGHILAITFTAKAAGEMKERLQRLTGNASGIPMTCTIHSLGYTLIREYKPEYATYSIADETMKAEKIREALTSCGLGDSQDTIREAGNLIEKAKQNLLVPDELEDSQGSSLDPATARAVYSAYREALSSGSLLDFDDLVFETVRALESDPAFRDSCRKRFTHVFVDEYQDLNHGQYRMIRAIVPENGDITVIGDPDQAIYGFRGSDSVYFTRFKSDFPGAAMITLDRNYRSTDTILGTSFQMISAGSSLHEYPRTRVTSGIGGPKTITVLESPTEKSEAVAIGKTIERIMGGTGFHSVDFHGHDAQHFKNLGFSDFAILARTSAQGRLICDALETGGIPCQHVSRDSIFAHPLIRELIERLGRDSIGESGTVSEKLAHLIELMPELGDEAGRNRKTRDAVDRIMAMAEPFGADMADFLKAVSLYSDQDTYDMKAEKVAVMTMHASKGLEFRVVFVAGCENGLIPFIREDNQNLDIEEERRLFYVAMTRAKDLLYLSYAKNRTRFGRSDKRNLSPFVHDIDRKSLRFEAPAFTKLEKPKKPVQLTLF